MSTTPVDPQQLVQTNNVQTPDGLWNVATTVTTTTVIDTVITAIAPKPPAGPVLIIPPGAKSSGILDNYPNWKQEKDGGTPGVVLPADMFNKYIDANQGRQFHAKQTGHAGVRWSTAFAKDTAPTNFVYDLFVKSLDWLQQGQLELDMNQVLPNGYNCFLCIQANFKSGVWDVTLNTGGIGSGTQWVGTNIKINPKDWTPNTWNHIRLKTSRDATGKVNYEGVELNDVYTLFDPKYSGLSIKKENWPIGDLINNYQTNGANASGTMDTFAKQMQVIYW